MIDECLNEPETETCWECSGKGIKKIPKFEDLEHEEECEECRGTGEVESNKYVKLIKQWEAYDE